MKRSAIAAVLALTVSIAYLVAWPVPVSPVAWDAPLNLGLTDPFDSNNRLQRARYIELGEHHGPEEIAVGQDGLLYATTSDGKIIRLQADGGDLQVFADTGGRPLGLGFDGSGNLWVANALLGVQRVSPDGQVELLVSAIDHPQIVYVNNLAIARSGKIYFSNSSAKFGAADIGDTYQASLLDILEHGGHGSILEYDPDTGSITTIIDGLNFANGLALSEDQQFLLIAETGSYRITKHWLSGRLAGTSQVLMDNLPGFPDNISNGLNGRFWIGLIAPRNPVVDRFSSSPFVRRLIMRLPRSLRPDAERSAHVIAINGDGEVLMNLQQNPADMSALTGVLETRDDLFLSSLFGDRIGRLSKRDLATD